MLFFLLHAPAFAATNPAPVASVQPVYPAAALHDHVGGTVILRIAVDAAGAVTDAQVLQGVREDVDAAAVVAAKAMQFTPATDDAGAPVVGSVDYAFSFALNVSDEQGNAVPGTLQVHFEDVDGLDIPGVRFTLQPRDGGEPRSFTGSDGGFVNAPFLDPGLYDFVCDHDGFSSAAGEVEVKAGETRTTTIKLTPAGPAREVVVIGLRQRWREVNRAARVADPSPETGVYELTRRDVESTPGALEDVTRAVHKLPGVASDSDLLGTFAVRGMKSDDVVFLLDRVPLDNPFHLAGFNSIFNPDMIEKVDFYAGAPPSRVPDSTSAVMSVQSWEGKPRDDRHDLDGAIDVSMSTARGFVMGPIGKSDNLTFAVAARRSYLEAYFGAMKALNLLDTAIAAPEYDELSARLAWRFGKQRLLLTGMRTSDHLALLDSDDDSAITVGGTFKLDDVVYLASLDHRAEIGTSVLQTTVAYTTDASVVDKDIAGSVHRTTTRDQVYARTDLTAAPWSSMDLRFGASAQARHYTFDGPVQDTRATPTWSALPLADRGLELIDLEGGSAQTQLSGYAEAETKLLYGDGKYGIRDRVGVRVTDVLRTGEVLVSPSAGISVPLPSGTIPKITVGMYHHVVEDPLVISAEYGNPDIRAERSTQIVAGFDQAFPTFPGWKGGLIRVEGYYAELSDLVVNPDTEAAVADGLTYTNEGSGRNFGVDAMIATSSDRVNLVLNGGFLDARVHNPMNEVFPQDYVPGQAQTWTLGGSAEFQASPRWRFTTRYDYHSGRPMSEVAVASDSTVQQVSLNSDRLSDFHQLDLRAEWRNALPKLRLSVYLEVLSVAYVAWQSDFLPIVTVEDGVRTDSMFYHLPTRPFLGIRGEF